MKRKTYFLAFAAVIFLIVAAPAKPGGAAVSINVQIGAPPPVTFPAPPEVVVIPGTYIYYAPGISFDLFFYRGYWWRPWHGRWYRSQYYRGPWVYMAPRWVPRPIIGLSPGWHSRPPMLRRVPYWQLRRNWRRWERDRYWERDRRWHERGGYYEDHGRHGEHRGHEDHGMGMGMGR